MANPIDELRSTLLSRAKPQQGQQAPAQPTGPAAQPYSPNAPGAAGASGLIGTGVAGLLGADRAEGPVSKKQPVPSLLSNLRDAIGGGTGGSSTPKTGMTPPAWPPMPMPMGPSDIPIGLPNDSSKVPPRWERFETGQKMAQAYRDGWSPNPMLIRIMNGDY